MINKQIYILFLSEDRKSITSKAINISYKNEFCLNLFLRYNNFYSSETQLTAKLFRENGFSDIVGKIDIPSKLYWDGNVSELDDNKIVSEEDLAKRLKYLYIQSLINDNKLGNYLKICISENSLIYQKKDIQARLDHYNVIIDAIKKFKNENNYDLLTLQPDDSNISDFVLITNVLISHRIYINIRVSLSNYYCLKIVRSKYEMPILSIECKNQKFDFFEYSSKKHSPYDNVDDVINMAFKKPDDFKNNTISIRKIFKDKLNIDISLDDILYDLVRNCYCLRTEKEEELFSDFKARDINCKEIYKYTTLSTLMKILNSRKIRMNSIVAMNDKTEGNYVSELIRTYTESIEQKSDKYLFADRKFITSFTKLKNDLKMWRLYGDNGKGVCLVFEMMEGRAEKIKEIIYIHKHENFYKDVTSLMNSIKESKINFRIALIEQNDTFIKSKEFGFESECRLLEEVLEPTGWYVNSEYNIITPYIEKDLYSLDVKYEKAFPLKLKAIILGSAMSEKDLNKYQIENILKDKCLFDIKVEINVKDIYRA